ncbi:P-loop containing nucleoside triphosphate hydrolase protein [Trichoderma chlorosporum]
MQEEHFKVNNRSITDNNIGDNVTFNQGDVHHHHAPAPRPWKPIRLIPYLQNKEFVNRPDLVDKLNSLLPLDSKSFNDAALWGLGGSGKTQLALEYAYRKCENPQSSVFWVHADTKAAFTHDYKSIAEMFGLEALLNGPELELFRAVNNRIQSEPQWLLVLDNADNLSLFGVGEAQAQETSGNLFDFIPKGTAVGSVGTVLWTSRDGQIAGSLVRPSHRAIQVSNMTSVEARELLTVSRGKDFDDDESHDEDDDNHGDHGDHGNDKDSDIDKLLEELQWFPLAISQAGAYMRRAETTVQEYLVMLFNNEERWPLLNEEQFDLYRKPSIPNSILKTWSISINYINQENMLASEMLRVIAYFNNQDIPYNIIDDAARSISTVKLTSLDIKRAVIRLKEFSFLRLRKGKYGSQSYEMHKLVQEATRYNNSTLEDATRYNNSTIEPTDLGVKSRRVTADFSRIAIEVISKLFPNLLEEDLKAGEKDKFLDMLKPGEKYFAHAIEVAGWAEKSNQENTVRALLYRVSVYLHFCKRWKEKESVDARILALCLNVLGPNHLDTILCEQSIAENYKEQNRYQEASDSLARVVRSLKSSVGVKDFYTLRALHRGADLMCKVSHFEQAEKLQADAIKLLEKLDAADGRVAELMAESLHCLARAYYGQQKYDEAGAVCIQWLTHCRDNLEGARCHWYATMAERAIVFKSQTQAIHGTFPWEAINPIQSLVSEIGDGIQRQTHLDNMSRLELMILVKSALGKYLDVVGLRIKVIAHQSQTGSAFPSGVLKFVDSIANRRLQVAYFHAQVVDHYCKTLGENHYKTITKMQYHASLLHDLGRYNEAESVQVKVVGFLRDAIGEQHPYTLDSMVFLAVIYFSLRRDDESRLIQDKVAVLYSKILGRPFSLHFQASNGIPTMSYSSEDSELRAMQQEFSCSLSNLRYLASSPREVTAAASVNRQPAVKSTTTNGYRPLFLFSLLVPFVTVILYYWIKY